MSDLRRDIGGLPAAERFKLPDALWESLEADAVAITDEQRAELDYRVAKYERNPADVIPWEQVRAGLRAALAPYKSIRPELALC